jgi:hypothetical protein
MSEKAQNGIDLATYQMAEAFTRIGRRAVQRAKEKSRQLGVPNVCSINGRIYYELPNGELTLDDPNVTHKSPDQGS